MLPPSDFTLRDPAILAERFARAILYQNRERSFSVQLGSEPEAEVVAHELVKLGVGAEIQLDGVTILVRRSVIAQDAHKE